MICDGGRCGDDDDDDDDDKGDVICNMLYSDTTTRRRTIEDAARQDSVQVDFMILEEVNIAGEEEVAMTTCV
jgi:hypothetical protein